LHLFVLKSAVTVKPSDVWRGAVGLHGICGVEVTASRALRGRFFDTAEIISQTFSRVDNANNKIESGFVQERRLSSLDAVRGLAACIVVISHCYLTMISDDRRTQLESSFWFDLLRPLHNGDAAVIIFFVLSGYVLSLPFFRGTQLTYPRYVVRRFCRIYIPFAVSVFLALLFYALSGPPNAPGASEWFNALWPPERPGISVILGHILMLGTNPNIRLNPSLWTLVYEMRVSLLFPLLILLCRDSRIALVGGLILLKLSTKGLSCDQCHHPAHAESFGVTLLWTVQIIPYFMTGILLSKHRAQLHQLYERIPKALAVALFIIPALAFMVKPDFVLAKLDALYAFGAAVLIMLAVENAGFRDFLDHRIPQWLGRISYSTYLIHLPLMLAIAPVLLGWMPPLAAAAVLFILSLAAATLMHAVVETPAINLGHRLTRRAKIPAQSAQADA
jgi:peptidoglycan/LPS O-acetylase OafA/YrhL